MPDEPRMMDLSKRNRVHYLLRGRHTFHHEMLVVLVDIWDSDQMFPVKNLCE